MQWKSGIEIDTFELRTLPLHAKNHGSLLQGGTASSSSTVLSEEASAPSTSLNDSIIHNALNPVSLFRRGMDYFKSRLNML